MFNKVNIFVCFGKKKKRSNLVEGQCIYSKVYPLIPANNELNMVINQQTMMTRLSQADLTNADVLH